MPMVEPPRRVQAGARPHHLRRALRRSPEPEKHDEKTHFRLARGPGLAGPRFSSEGRPKASHWDKAPSRTNDLPALQNGAKLFVNYCLNCHSAAFMRYNRLQDIGITEQQIKDNLLFTTDKVGDHEGRIDPARTQGMVRRQRRPT
jgi:cytochrome c1